MSDSIPRIEVSRDESALIRIAREYESLVERADWINPYFSPEWMSCWWKRSKSDRAPLVLLAFSKEDELLGYWPFVERPGLLGSKGLWPFVYDEANYHFPTCEKNAAFALVEALRELIGNFLFAWIPQVPAPFWDDFLGSQVTSSRNLSIFRSQRSSPLVEPVEGLSFDDFWVGRMGKKSRKSFRYDERSLKDRGSVIFETSDGFEEVRSIMAATCLVEVESRKNLENAGLYTIRGKRGFFFELLPELAKAGRARVSILRVDDHPIAWQLELLLPGRSCLHHLAYDENWKAYSPGKQLLRFCLERCWNEGRITDFLPAPFAYKEKYATCSQPAHELHWITPSIRGRIARRLILWNVRLRQRMRERSPGIASAIAREEVKNRHFPEE